MVESGHTCALQNTVLFESGKDFKQYVVENEFSCVFGIHLWRAGKLLLGVTFLFWSFYQFSQFHNNPCYVNVIFCYQLCSLKIDCSVPFSIIFGGTDLNEHVQDNKKLHIMTQVVEKAKYVADVMRKG